MTYTIEVRDGNHIVNIAPAEEVDKFTEVILETLKCMTGYKLAEVFAETLNDYRRTNK